jgi:YihY family inner membrane protein
VSTASLVPETCLELEGEDARAVLRNAGRRRLLGDAFIRLRASDGFSHARSLAFVTSLLMVQGVIGLVGLATALGDRGLGSAIARTIEAAAPGAAGRLLTRTVHHANATGASAKYFALTIGLVGALITGSTLMGQIERALNRLYGVEQDRPSVQKYGRAFVMFVTVGVLATASFAVFAFGRQVGHAFGNEDVRRVFDVVRWPLALVLLVATIAGLFRWSPRRHQPAWSWLAYGASLSVLLWAAVTIVLGVLLRASGSFGDTYGPLAGMVAVLLWALLSSIAVLYGAAVAAQLEAVRAGVPAPRRPATTPLAPVTTLPATSRGVARAGGGRGGDGARSPARIGSRGDLRGGEHDAGSAGASGADHLAPVRVVE